MGFHSMFACPDAPLDISIKTMIILRDRMLNCCAKCRYNSSRVFCILAISVSMIDSRVVL